MKILVVEDDALLLKAISHGLRRAGYEVEGTDDPREALRRIKDGARYALVVSDLEMPHMHGDELCREVQQVALTPFIIVSGYASVFSRASDCGAKCLLKPYATRELYEAVNGLIGVPARA
jgi:DNA-binding response OmpR family regulator